MDIFSIAQLSQFSGVKPHTIRIWEQRYNALKPIRSEGNTRRYDSSQLRRLLNIVSLMDSGYKISELGGLTDQELFDLLKKVEEEFTPPMADHFISQLIAAGLEYDEATFDKLFSHCLLRYGMRDSYTRIIYPLLERLGLMWATDKLHPAHEHFISNLIRQKLSVSIDAQTPPEKDSETWLLFLPEDEFHEIGLMMAHQRLCAAGKRSIYLGPSTPLATVLEAAKATQPDNLLLFLVHRNTPKAIKTYLEDIASTFPGKNIYLAANPQLLAKTRNNTIIRLNTLEDLERKLHDDV